MTTFALMSDVHLEYGGINFDLPKADILLLAGDIFQTNYLKDSFQGALNGETAREFISAVSKKYKHTIIVPGNHEHYDGCIETDSDVVNSYFKSNGIDNVFFGSMGVFETKTVKVVYATLWTDLNRGCPLTVSDASYRMNDYSLIRTSVDPIPGFPTSRLLLTKDTLALHAKHRQHIELECSNTSKKVVVMTHHAPMLELATNKNKPSSIDYCYGCTDMEDIIAENDGIKVWVYGHVHTRSEQEIYGTKFISNCRGYLGYESAASSFKVKTFIV